MQASPAPGRVCRPLGLVPLLTVLLGLGGWGAATAVPAAAAQPRVLLPASALRKPW